MVHFKPKVRKRLQKGNRHKIKKGVSKGSIYTVTPQGGFYKHQEINKSPLGDLGVRIKERAVRHPLITVQE